LHLLLGACFIHTACKKHIVRRHDMATQGLAFLGAYEQLRGPGASQEVNYNLGRLLQQMGILYMAVQFYKRALKCLPAGNLPTMDLSRECAHNLAVIYNNCGNVSLARHFWRTHCVV